MTAQELLGVLSQVVYLGLFVVAAIRLVRSPSLAAIDTCLFLGVITAVLLARDVAGLLGLQDHPALGVLTWVGVCALPLILLRLADDFRPQPSGIMIGAWGLFVVVAAIGVLVPQPWPGPVRVVPVVWVVALGSYASWAFVNESRTTYGVTRRRMQAVALGSLLLATVLLLVGVSIVLPATQPAVSILNQAAGMGLMLAYFLGFAPPGFLRRAWQEPILRRLVAETPELIRAPTLDEVLRRVRERARELTGADDALIGLWDAARGSLVYHLPSGGVHHLQPGEWIGGRAFLTQRVVYTGNAEADAPEHAAEYREAGIRAIAAAPITADGRRLGVLAVYAARPFLFTDDVAGMTALVAEQAATVIRSHALGREAAEVRALAEATRLKQDFLSVVAHDVRTPLTTILINAELLDRSLGDHPQHARRIASLRAEATRLKLLVEEYLQVVQTAEGERELRLEPLDLRQLVGEAIDGVGPGRDRVQLIAAEPVPGLYDRARVFQLVQNLVGNALKYSEADTPVEVRLWAADGLAHLSVTDHGIGIGEEDLRMVFERFHRGANIDDRRHGGLGLGLYISRLVAREHGGDITVTSQLGAGTTFTATLARGQHAMDAAAGDPTRTAGESTLEPASGSSG
ncbi:MAG TPA: ATP-binding protein [candidate division Zixibacteria bacterium]|nr:ATP-binding protein [candidate division Zixibacteria bacterium]